MQSLWQQLKITQTLIDCLSSMILLDTTNHQSQTTSKNLFDLITELPPMQPMVLLTNLSHFLQETLFTSTIYRRQALEPTASPGSRPTSYQTSFDSSLVYSTIHPTICQRSYESTIASPGLPWQQPGQHRFYLPTKYQPTTNQLSQKQYNFHNP